MSTIVRRARSGSRATATAVSSVTSPHFSPHKGAAGFPDVTAGSVVGNAINPARSVFVDRVLTCHASGGDHAKDRGVGRDRRTRQVAPSPFSWI
jgi:hypothetical protein